MDTMINCGGVFMLKLVVYDIPVEYDPIRNKLAKLLQNYGLERIQKSVFIGKLSNNNTENLAIDINKLLGDIDADVRIFSICSKCLESSIVVREGSTSGYQKWLDKMEEAIIYV